MFHAVSFSSVVSDRVAIIRQAIDDSTMAHPKKCQPKPSGEMEMKVTQSRTERTSAFRLVHQNYYRAGLTADNAMQMRVMKHHLADTTEILIAKQHDEVEFTVTLVRDGKYGVPCESLFSNEIAQMRSSGIRIAEVSCVASKSGDENKKAKFELLDKMISLTIQVARFRGIDQLVLAVHPRHAKVYQRLFGCVIRTEVKDYEAVQGNQAVLCTHHFAELDQHRYPLYDHVYGTTYGSWQMTGTRMSDDEKRFFRQVLNCHSDQPLPMVA